jgi:hypothetical protein
MYDKGRRPSEIIAEQRRIIEEQQDIIAILKGALAAAGEGAPPAYKPWMTGLTPQEQALMGALYRHYPNPIGKYELLELIPGYDHVQERQVQLVSVKVHHLRKKLGGDAIENVWGRGYRLGEATYEAMQKTDVADEPASRSFVTGRLGPRPVARRLNAGDSSRSSPHAPV